MPATPCPLTLALLAWPWIWIADLLRYVIPAGLVTLLVARLPAAWRSRRTVRAMLPSAGQRPREFLNSMLTVLIFSVNGAVIFALARASSRVCRTEHPAYRLRLEQLVRAASHQPPIQLQDASGR